MAAGNLLRLRQPYSVQTHAVRLGIDVNLGLHLYELTADDIVRFTRSSYKITPSGLVIKDFYYSYETISELRNWRPGISTQQPILHSLSCALHLSTEVYRYRIALLEWSMSSRCPDPLQWALFSNISDPGPSRS